MGIGKSASNHDFAVAQHNKIQHSKFGRSHVHKTTLDASYIVPVYLDEVLPGDTVDINLSHICRKATPTRPTMDNEEIEFYAFYDKMRNLWNGTKEFFGQNDSGTWTNTNNLKLPTVKYDCQSSRRKSIGEYMGLPLISGATASADYQLNALPLAMYFHVYNEYFNNQNTNNPYLIDKETCKVTSVGSTSQIDYAAPCVRAMKKPDYFTSCLPVPQKHDAVSLPVDLSGLVPVYPHGDPVIHPPAEHLQFHTETGVASGVQNLVYSNTGSASSNDIFVAAGNDASVGSAAVRIVGTNLVGSLDGNEAFGYTDINSLRLAVATQRIFEKDARGGTRYREMLKAHFGVYLNPLEDDVPEFLGESRSSINMQQVPNTTSQGAQGSLAGYSLTNGGGKLCNKTFKEHGYIMVVAVIRQKKTYQQGLPRLFQRSERLDFYHPSLAHIGEQPVYASEIYLTKPTSAIQDISLGTGTVFGYNEAWSDYRYKQNRTSGWFKFDGDTDGTDLKDWQYADRYVAEPSLNASWMVDNSMENINPTLNYPGNPNALSPDESYSQQYILDMFFGEVWTRSMPMFSIPGLLDHN